MTEPHRAIIARRVRRFLGDIAIHGEGIGGSGRAGPHAGRASQPAQPAHPVPQPQPYPVPYWPQYQPQYQQPHAAAPMPQQAVPPAPSVQKPPRDQSWIGKLLAVAGVAVTLIGVVLLLVLAAQAGILRPEIRVAGGVLLAGALVAVAIWLYNRPGGHVGAIALAATGIAAAYIDVIAITTIYDWVSAPVGLVVAAVIGGGGLTLARRWDSQHLGRSGAGSADRAGTRGRRWHHAAARRLHVGARRRIATGAIGQGLDLAALRPHCGQYVSAAHRSACAEFQRRARRVAGCRVRHRGGTGDRRCADPAALDLQPGADGAGDRRRCTARALCGTGRRPRGGRADGGRPRRDDARDRAHRRSLARGRQDGAAHLVGVVGDLRDDRRGGRIRRRRRGPGAAGNGDRRGRRCASAR